MTPIVASISWARWSCEPPVPVLRANGVRATARVCRLPAQSVLRWSIVIAIARLLPCVLAIAIVLAAVVALALAGGVELGLPVL